MSRPGRTAVFFFGLTKSSLQSDPVRQNFAITFRQPSVMPFCFTRVLRQLTNALVAFLLIFTAFTSGLSASHGMSNFLSCAAMDSRDSGLVEKVSTDTESAVLSTEAIAGDWAGSSNGDKSTGVVGTGCCGSYCAPSYSVPPHHADVVFLPLNEIWTAAGVFLRSAESRGLKRPPRAVSARNLRA